jgi:hypothetical protein
MNYFREAKVTNLDEYLSRAAACLFPLLHDEDIRRFKIAVKYAFIMGGIDAGNHLVQHRHCPLNIQSTFAPQQLVQTFPIHVFHYQKEHAFRAFAEIRDVDDIWMADRRGCPSFALKPGDCFAFLEPFVTQYVRAYRFHRHPTGDQILVSGQIDLPHSAAAKSFFQ